MKKFLKLLFILIVASFLTTPEVKAQTTIDTTFNILGFFPKAAKIWKPANYTAGRRKYPTILVLYGTDEDGTPDANPADMLLFGPLYYTNLGVNFYFNRLDGGAPDTCIIIGCQTGDFPGANVTESFVDICRGLSYVDNDRIYATGYSQGAQSFENYVAASTGNAQKLTFIWSLQGVKADNQAAVAANFAPTGRWYGIEGASDDRDVSDLRDLINSVNPGHAVYTLVSSGPMTTHGGWNTGYDTSYSPAATGGISVYRYMLQYTLAAPPPTAPTLYKKTYYRIRQN